MSPPRIIIPLREPSHDYAGSVMLASGHRPFFLMAALAAAGLLPLWLVAWSGYLPLNASWHGHEMVFGFAAAAIGGFLMAAVPKWTNCPPITGRRLLLLIGLYLAGRIGMLAGHGLDWADVLFLPVLAIFILADIHRVRNKRNYQIPAMLFLLTGLNIAWHIGYPQALWAGIYLIAGLIALIGGRIVPAFTQSGLRMVGLRLDPDFGAANPAVDGRVRRGYPVPCRGKHQTPGQENVKPEDFRGWPADRTGLPVGNRKDVSQGTEARPFRAESSHVSTPVWLDRAAVPAVLAVVVAEVMAPLSSSWGPLVSGLTALVAGLLLLLRMAGWQTRHTFRVPLVWILHAGYVWVPIGFLLKAAADLGNWVMPTAALHALTTGAIGVMILAVASRAALGHSGRPLVPSRWTVLAYGLVLAAAILRVAVPYSHGVLASGVLWTLGWGLFAVVYWPILTRPRSDGLPG